MEVVSIPDIMDYESIKKFLVNDTAQYTKQIAEAGAADKLLMFATGNSGHPTPAITALCAAFLPETARNIIMVTNLNNQDGKRNVQINIFCNSDHLSADSAKAIAADQAANPVVIYNYYYNVPLQEFIGQGVVDAGAAVKGPGAFNARRLSWESDRQ